VILDALPYCVLCSIYSRVFAVIAEKREGMMQTYKRIAASLYS